VRAVFTIVLGRPFIGILRFPVTVNAIVFLALAAGFWFALLPAFEGAPGDHRTPALWGFATWLILAPPLLELMAGPAQRPLRAAAERAMHTAPAVDPAPPPARLHSRAITLVGAAVLLPFGFAIAQIPWVGLPLVFAIGAAVSALVWFDEPLSSCGYDHRERVRVIWQNRWRALGVGTGLQLATAVPFLNLLLLPSLAVVATTSAFARFEKQAVGTPPAQQ